MEAQFYVRSLTTAHRRKNWLWGIVQLVGVGAFHPVPIICALIERGGCRFSFAREREVFAKGAAFRKVWLTFEGPSRRVEPVVAGVKHRLDHELIETVVSLGSRIRRPKRLHFEVRLPKRNFYLFLSGLYAILRRTGAGAAYLDYESLRWTVKVGGVLLASSSPSLAVLERAISGWASRVGLTIRVINLELAPTAKRVA